MITPSDIFLWILSGTASLTILAIFWAWASGRLKDPIRSRDRTRQAARRPGRVPRP